MLLIGIYPYLQAIGLECPLWVYPTQEEGDPRSKLSKSRHKKNAVAAFVEHMVLEKAFRSSLFYRRVFFLHEKHRSSLGRYSESRHPKIHLPVCCSCCREVHQVGRKITLDVEASSNPTHSGIWHLIMAVLHRRDI